MGRFWQFWNSLSQGARDNTIGGLLVVIAATGATLFRKSIVAGLRRLLGGGPSRQEVIIKVEQQPAPLRIEESKSLPPQIEEPNPAPPAANRGNLPRSTKVPFVARHDKDGNDILAQLQDELSPEKYQLVVLWGDGGLGKTALAIEAARSLIGTSIHRLVWTSADGRQDYSLSTLLDEIATQLGDAELRKLALEPKKEAVQTLIAADPATLIVLDNFETIAPEEQQRCAEWIASHAPCPALITTREQVNDARNVPLGRMSEAEANEFLTKLIAQSPNPKPFANIERQRIIQAAGANPLVMQWVIAQIERAQHADQVLNDLARGKGTAAQRVFDRSFNLPQVGADGRDTLLALSLFVPDASRAALAEVAGFGDDTERLNAAVSALASLHLLEMTDTDGRLIVEGLTRDLARARLSKDERDIEFRHQFVKYFLHYAQSHSKITPEDFDALELERDNALNAADMAFEMDDWEGVMGIRSALEFFLDLHGYWDEAIQRGNQAVEAAKHANDEWRIAMFAGNVGTIYQNQGDYAEARILYQQAHEAFIKLGSEINIAVALHQLAMLAQAQDETEEARRLYNASLEIKRRLGDQRGIATTLHQLARLAQDQGEIKEARRLYSDNLEIAKQLGNQDVIASTLHQMAILAQDQGEIEEARRLYNDSLEIEKRLGNQSGIAITLGQLGLLAEQEGKIAEAARLFQEALIIFEKLRSPYADLARESLERVQGKS